MTNRNAGDVRDELERRLRTTRDCIPIEHFGAPLTESDRDHLAFCTRCQAEFALWQGFSEPGPRPEEDASVAWVISELRAPAGRRVSTARSRERTRTQTYLPTAAALLLAAAVGYVFWDPEPRVDELGRAEQTYRTARLEVLTASGELAAAPAELKWVTVEGAVSYDVRVLEVDGAEIWSTSTPETRITLPAAVVARFVEGKTIAWDVTARNRGGDPLAVSGRQRFRVSLDSPPRRD